MRKFANFWGDCGFKNQLRLWMNFHGMAVLLMRNFINKKMDTNIVDSLLKVGKLKSLKRTGWVRENMPDPESVAEHTFRICFLILALEDKLDVSKDRLLHMALVHDIEEAFTQDPVTQRGIKDVGKHDHRVEKSIVKEIVSGFSSAEKLLELWESHLPEKGTGVTREASILYQLGKIATAWQALEYELSGQDEEVMSEWWENARQYVKEPVLVELLDVMEARRKRV